MNSDKIMFCQIDGDVPFWLFLDVLNLDFQIIFGMFFVCHFSFLCPRRL